MWAYPQAGQVLNKQACWVSDRTSLPLSKTKNEWQDNGISCQFVSLPLRSQSHLILLRRCSQLGLHSATLWQKQAKWDKALVIPLFPQRDYNLCCGAAFWVVFSYPLVLPTLDWHRAPGGVILSGHIKCRFTVRAQCPHQVLRANHCMWHTRLFLASSA